jgi:hypothetical protein
MAAMLIYPAAGDSEGTLGGLVQQGGRNRLALVFLAALRRILWCSADGVAQWHRALRAVAHQPSRHQHDA